MPGYADFEPLLEDNRVARLQGQIAQKDPEARDVTFLTYVQPATTVDHEGIAVPIGEVAVFAVLRDNPRSPTHQLMTTASVWLQDWRASDALRNHFVAGGQDPALPIFRRVFRESQTVISNLREMNP